MSPSASPSHPPLQQRAVEGSEFLTETSSSPRQDGTIVMIIMVVVGLVGGYVVCSYCCVCSEIPDDVSVIPTASDVSVIPTASDVSVISTASDVSEDESDDGDVDAP